MLSLDSYCCFKSLSNLICHYYYIYIYICVCVFVLMNVWIYVCIHPRKVESKIYIISTKFHCVVVVCFCCFCLLFVAGFSFVFLLLFDGFDILMVWYILVVWLCVFWSMHVYVYVFGDLMVLFSDYMSVCVVVVFDCLMFCVVRFWFFWIFGSLIFGMFVLLLLLLLLFDCLIVWLFFVFLVCVVVWMCLCLRLLYMNSHLFWNNKWIKFEYISYIKIRTMKYCLVVFFFFCFVLYYMNNLMILYIYIHVCIWNNIFLQVKVKERCVKIFSFPQKWIANSA